MGARLPIKLRIYANKTIHETDESDARAVKFLNELRNTVYIMKKGSGGASNAFFFKFMASGFRAVTCLKQLRKQVKLLRKVLAVHPKRTVRKCMASRF